MKQKDPANAAKFEEACLLLQDGHRKGSDTPEQTLNRLFQKHLNEHQKDIADNRPWLSSANVVVTEQLWPKRALIELAPPGPNRPKAQRGSGCDRPILRT
jgi:hypothetical protein